MLQPEIVTQPARRYVGLHATFRHALSPDSDAAEVIGALWGRFSPLSDSVPGAAGAAHHGIIWGGPEETRAHPHELQYLAGVAVEGRAPAPDGMTFRDLPEALFAVFVHRGPIHRIAATVGAIYREWLPGSGFEHAGVADVEVYDQRFSCDSEDSEMEYWISIRPAAGSRT